MTELNVVDLYKIEVCFDDNINLEKKKTLFIDLMSVTSIGLN